MSEELINTVYILATISQHIEFPFRNSWLSKIFQNAFTSGIDKESLRKLGYLTGRSLSGTFHYVREIIRFQKCEDIFAWPNKLLHPFQVSDIPKNIEKAAFFITCTNKDYIEEIEGYILVVKLFQPEGILECKHGEEWKSCSSQKMGNYKPKNFSVILGFVKNWEDIKIEEKTVEENKDNEAKTKNVEKSPQDFEENTTKNINADQINEKLRQMEEELSKSKLSNECLQAELMREKLKNKNTSSNMHRVIVMIGNMSKKIYNTRIDLEKKSIYLKERAEESQLCIKNILDNCQSKFNQLQSFVDDSAGSKNELDNKKTDFSIAFNAISDYFQCSNKTAQDCLQKFKELGNECYSLKDKCNEIINEIDNKLSSLVAKNNEREEKTKKIFRSENSSVSRFSHFPALKRKKYGLVNIGNSCHLNSVLQIFASIPNFIEKIRNIENNLFYSLGEVLSSIKYPYPFLTSEKLRKLRDLLAREDPKFGGSTYNDCKKLYVIIVNLFMELTKNSMFLINKNEAVVCENNHRKELSEPQVFLTIPDNELGIKDWLNKLENDQKLYKGDDNLFCEDCGHRSDSDIVTKSIKAHEILALCNAKSKNSIGNIPNRVSLGQSQYEIFGIISYSEKHYIAYTREEGIWNEYNDQDVRENKSPNPKTSYMLFYRKTYN